MRLDLNYFFRRKLSSDWDNIVISYMMNVQQKCAEIVITF